MKNVMVKTCRGYESFSSVDSMLDRTLNIVHLMESDKYGDEVAYIIMTENQKILKYDWFDDLDTWVDR